ncbi:hypothetical protein Bacsa_1476 [Phocaeicola salanitronis DSM 18170]|uniref:Lipoprotein n=1 Tax=Phocaeicola salanitronis (strain DSM 18170 / JCM 13657 / CCUG 60908 / BL78) TaxID=667015 RepID=F0QZ19_PHOSB|nr:hypothetical protein [Phocaeicola salanitronis]ADY36048.1 hypothetical protein Bacsa_1476 [Phocaeicola salanitronis DSM 18170]
MKQKYILPICLLLAACSSEEAVNNLPDPQPTDTAVSFSANIHSAMSRSGDDTELDIDDYRHQHFIKDKSRIRIVNTVNYSVPGFNTPGEYEEYVYKGEGDENENTDPYPNFAPYIEEDPTNEGFDWNEITPTANHFIFEAVCYPLGYEPFDKVQEDQSTIDNLWKSDLLLAYHWQDLDERYKIVELHFRHAFAMIKVEADLPISMMPQDAGGFPRNAVTSVRLVKIQRGYEVDYTSAVDNNRLRPVQATGEEESIEMYQIEGPDENNPNTQSYTYCGILPAQGIESSEDGRPKELVEFTILTYPGEPIEGTDQWKEPVEKTYYYVPQDNFSLVQEHITTLKLTYNHEVPEIIQVGASIEEWGNWYTGIVLEPETETTPAEPQP